MNPETADGRRQLYMMRNFRLSCRTASLTRPGVLVVGEPDDTCGVAIIYFRARQPGLFWTCPPPQPDRQDITYIHDEPLQNEGSSTNYVSAVINTAAVVVWEGSSHSTRLHRHPRGKKLQCSLSVLRQQLLPKCQTTTSSVKLTTHQIRPSKMAQTKHQQRNNKAERPNRSRSIRLLPLRQ